MKQIEKRISNIEKMQKPATTNKTMADLYNDPEILKEFHALYPTEQETKKMMDDYHSDLKERGLL